MFGIFSSLADIVRLGPREFVRQRFKLPIVKFVHDTVDLYKSRTKAGVNNVRDILFRGTVIALVTALLVWLSIFMYVAFYYVYVPTISHERPVYLKFKSCGEIADCDVQKGLCSFPSAHVQLTKRQQLLMSGQPYRIHLDLEMPESPVNRELGMFMVCADFRGKNGELLANSCRSTMLHYRGFLLDTIYKLLFSPFFVFGAAEEKQNIHVELFSDFEEPDAQPVTDIYVEIKSKHIEIYSAKFLLNANFTGLRYVMFHWPVLSAALGITANLFFIALVCLLSWYQIVHSEEYYTFIEKEKLDCKSIIQEYEDIAELKKNLSDISTVAKVYTSPFYIVYNVYTSFKKKYYEATRIPKGVLTYRPKTITKIRSKLKYDKPKVIKCGKCNKIVCAKHKISSCEKCAINNDLLILT